MSVGIRLQFELAKNIAYNSPYNKIRHGAVLVKGGSVINASCNKDNFSSFGTRFRGPDMGHGTHHAELGCILGLDRSITRGADVYVVRVGRSGNLLLSKPCDMCEAALRHVGVRRVYYSLNDGNFEFYRL